jgi:hypothetical protein
VVYSLRAAGGRANGDGAKKTRTRDRPKAVPAPEANAELQVNIDVCWMNLLLPSLFCFYGLIYVVTN